MTMRSQPRQATNPRNCYCSPDGSVPGASGNAGLPPGYCGTCDVCGKPGHTRHFPGASPVTGAWCDTHYRRTAWLHPLGHYGRWLYVFLLLFGVVLTVLKAAR